MAIIALKAWYLKQYEPIRKVIQRPCNLRLSRNSLLKTGLRVDFLDDRNDVEASEWFELYLEGKTVEFYIQGSGSYVVSNIDLVSQEIYFTKRASISGLDPVIYYSPQNQDHNAKEAQISALETVIEDLSKRSRIPLSLEVTPRPKDSPQRLSNSQFRKIGKSLLFIADVTPITSLAGTNKKASLLIDPNVCVEIGYALESKDNGQILLLNMERPELIGVIPFDMAGYRQLSFTNAAQLDQTLPQLIETLLQRYSLF